MEFPVFELVEYSFFLISSLSITVVTPGLLHFGIFRQNFEKNTAKNTTNTGNFPGLLHFFDIFFVPVRESPL